MPLARRSLFAAYFIKSLLVEPTVAFAKSVFDDAQRISRMAMSTSRGGGGALSTRQTEVMNPLVVCGPSGVGKGTIIAKFMEEHDGNDIFGFTISHTTRKPRKGEENGIHYHFITETAMKALLEEEIFLESALVHGNYYGTSWDAVRTVQRSGKRCLLDIDVQGVKKLKSLEKPGFLEPAYLFIAPPSVDILRARLQGRGSESEESILRRTGAAEEEVIYGTTEGNFDAIIVNDDLDKAVVEFGKVVKKLYPNSSS